MKTRPLTSVDSALMCALRV